MAETLGIQTKRTGGRVVDCSGLENLAGKMPKTAETSENCGIQDAHNAMFTARSEGCDGNNVGTVAPGIYPGLDRIPLRNEPRVGEYSAIEYADVDLVALYRDTGDLMEVIDTTSGRVLYPPKVKLEPMVGARSGAQV